MAETPCEACEILDEQAVDFVEYGVTPAIASRLKNDKGFSSGSDVNTDCEALNNANDCLIYGMVEDLEKYDVCDIKTWLHEAFSNVYTVLKAMIMAICGLWTKVHCILSGLNTLLVQLTDTTQTSSFSAVTAYALSSGVNSGNHIDNHLDQVLTPTTEYPWVERTFANGGLTQDGDTVTIGTTVNGVTYNSITYPSDGVAIVGCCAYMSNYTGKSTGQVVFYHSGESRTTEMLNKRGLHISDYQSSTVGQEWTNTSVPMTTAIKVKKGKSLKIWVNATSNSTSSGEITIHQVWSTFIPDFSSALSMSVDQDLFESCGE